MILIIPTIVRSVQREKISVDLGMFWHFGTHEESLKFRPAGGRANGNHIIGCWMDLSALLGVTAQILDTETLPSSNNALLL